MSSFATNKNSSILLEPMTDGGAPYSAIGVTGLCVLRSPLGLPCLETFDPMPKSFAQ